jgi:hypothetical protein
VREKDQIRNKGIKQLFIQHSAHILSARDAAKMKTDTPTAPSVPHASLPMAQKR